MPDDERTRRRLGDATKSKIADLADGWTTAPPTVEPVAEPADVRPPDAEAAPPTPRPRGKTLPPPPPGSAQRKALESQILDTKDLVLVTGETPAPTILPLPPLVAPPALPPRKSPTMPPPLPTGPRARPPTMPSTIPAPPSPLRTAPPSGEVIPLDKPKPRAKALTSPAPAVAVNAARPSASALPPARGPSKTTPPPMLPFIPPPGPATHIDIAPLGPARGDETSLPTIPQAALVALAIPDPITPHGLSAATGKLPTVPLGEFDDGPATTMDDGRLRQQQAQRTMKRDAAEALLKMPPPAPPPRPPPPPPPVEEIASVSAALRGDPTAVDPTYERGDPTSVSGASGGGGPLNQTSIGGPGATLRAGAALRRKRGVAGDVRYVFTALFGVRRARAELADLQVRQDTKQASRRRHLITLGRTAMLSEYQHAAMDESRVVFEQVEDERSGHAGQVAAADAELDRVRRDRESAARAAAAEIERIDADLAALVKKLEPLDKEATAVQRRADALREALAKLDAQIASTQNSLISVKGQRLDKAAVSAEVATLRADRQAVQRDEPIIAAELDTLGPRIAALRGQRATAQQRRAEILAGEERDKRRIEELLTAIGAKRKVVDRAAADAESARDNVLFDLGDKLYTDRPKKLAAQLAPIDAIDLELGEGERRIMELREILSNVDRTKLARGLAVVILVALALAGGAAAFVYLAVES